MSRNLGLAMVARPRGDYGIDAPAVPWVWTGIAALGLAGSLLLGVLQPAWASVVLLWYVIVLTLAAGAGAAFYWHTTLRGKFTTWARLLTGVTLPAGSQALDLGCGHGAVAVMIALRFPGAGVTGIDLWRSVDQSGNSIDTARANAERNGVADRVRFDTGDMTDLPYPDATFALITASVSIHNIATSDGRRRAIREAVRVLAPGGHIVIADIQRSREYADELTQAGLTVRGPRSLGWRMWWSGPWMPTATLSAAHPQA